MTHIQCAANYVGGDGVHGPRFSAQIAAAGSLGPASRLPAHELPATWPGESQEATWSRTDWMLTIDTPIADEGGHLVVAGITGRVSTQWQDAWVRMEVDPTWSVAVHAWTAEPVAPTNAATP